jgi:hypothetical protein
MNIKSIMPSSRRLTFSLIILSLAAIFLTGYYFYFIPRNRNILQKNGFGILDNIRKNILDRNQYLETSFINIIGEQKLNGDPKNMDQLQKQLDNYAIGAKITAIKYSTASRADSLKKIPGFNNALANGADSSVYLSGISHDSLIYQPATIKQPFYSIYVPAQNFIAPLVAYQKNELFESYLLISKTSGLVYMDAELAINPGIIEDSLVPKGTKALFAGIRDLNIKGVDYKMFYYPFKLGKAHYQLCGFLKSETYFNKLHQVPVNFIYPIVIALILIIMLLPIVKFYLMGKDEHVKYTDFILGILSFVGGTAMLTIIIIQVLLLWGADIRTKGYLENLSAQIDSSFTQELTSAYAQLNQLDSMVYRFRDSSNILETGDKKNYNVSSLLNEYFLYNCKNHSGCYYNFNRLSWVDAAGNQRMKGQLDSIAPIYTNVAARNYFKQIQNNEGFFLPALPSASYGLEPVNSWTNGDFSIIISMKSRLQNGFIATMSAQMPSVTQTIMPPGFGFCMMDAEGKVMLHSEMNRSLLENFIDKTEPSRPMKEALKSRQESYFKDLNLYGKNNALHIKPIAATPFYLAIFYDKGYIVPVNMRILTFSILFCILSFVSCLIIWMGIFRRKRAGNLFLHDPMYYLNWVMPKEKNIKFYILATAFLIAYLVIQLMMIFSFNYFEISNYAILILVVLLPVNIFSGLFIINYRVEKDTHQQDSSEDSPHPKKAITAIVLQPVAVAIIYWASVSSGYPLQSAFWYFEIFFFLFLCLITLLPRNTFKFLYYSSRTYLCLYSRFTTFLLACISILPASLYTWYAHNQEIIQSVKKEQLYLSNALRQRSVQNFVFMQKRNTLHPPANYYHQLQYNQGIYKIFGDVISPAVNRQTRNKEDRYERFYFSVANAIGSNYYDPQLIPALRDNATGNAWQWTSSDKKDSLSFWYSLYQDPTTANANNSLQVTSAYPKRFLYAAPSFRGILLLIAIAAFMYGLYVLLRYMSERLFLRKYIPGLHDKNNPASNGIEVFFEKYKTLKEKMGTTTGSVQANDIAAFRNEYDFYKPAPHNKAIYKQESDMIAAQDKYKDFYLFIWNKCDAREKYMLLDFAQNGFVNFKNTEVIYRLFQKGIFTVMNEEVKLFSASFRSFVLLQIQNPEMTRLQKEFQQGSSWQTFRIPLLMVLLIVAAFIFFTQEQTFQKISALVAGVSTIFSLVLKYFSDGTGLFSSAKK